MSRTPPPRGLGHDRVGRTRPQPQVGCSTVPCSTHVAVHAPRGDLHLHPAPAVHAAPRRLQLGSAGAPGVVALGDGLAALPAAPPAAPARATGPTASSPSTNTTRVRRSR